MYARTAQNKVALDVLRAVCSARARNFRIAHIRRVTAPLRDWLYD